MDHHLSKKTAIDELVTANQCQARYALATKSNVEANFDIQATKINSLCWTDGRQSRNFMNINDSPDLCLGRVPQMPTAYFSASSLIPVEIDRRLFFL